MKNGQATVKLLQSIAVVYRPVIVPSHTGTRHCRKHTPHWECSTLLEKRKKRMDRIAILSEILTQNPNDAFARYGLALEYSNGGNVEQALQEFAKLLAVHPDYTAGYFMAAQTLAKADRLDEARKMLGDGILSAKRTGNAHAQSEMEGMLAELG